MLSSVLNSEKAILVNVAIMRAFVQMRKILLNDAKMSAKLDEIENRLDTQEINTIVLMDKLRAINDNLKAKNNKPKIGFNEDLLKKSPSVKSLAGLSKLRNSQKQSPEGRLEKGIREDRDGRG